MQNKETVKLKEKKVVDRVGSAYGGGNTDNRFRTEVTGILSISTLYYSKKECC